MFGRQDCGDISRFGGGKGRVLPNLAMTGCYDQPQPLDDDLCDPRDYFNCDGTGLYEPPKLRLQDQVQLARTLQQKDHLASRVQEFEHGLEKIEKDLTLVKTEIEIMLEEQSCFQEAIDMCTDMAEINVISLEKLERHKCLIQLINREDFLLNELEATRRSLASANIENQTHALEMSDRIDEIQRIHTIRKDFEFNCRLGRENTIRRNAAGMRRREFLQTAKAQEEYWLEKTAAILPKPKLKKETVEKLRSFRIKTFEQIASAKQLGAADQETRRARQKNNLLILKRELDEQRELFLAANNLRKERAREADKVTAKTRQEIIAAGGNPFHLERLAAKEKMERMLEKKRRALEDEYMKRLEVECRKDEHSEKRRIKLRQTLEELWTAKTLEKRMMTKRAEQSYLEAIRKVGGPCEFEPQEFFEGSQAEQELFNFDLLVQVQQNNEQGHSTPLFPKGQALEFQQEIGAEEQRGQNLDQSEAAKPAGNAYFKITPEEIIFKDFELYKTYRKKVTVANRSNLRLRFSLREFVALGAHHSAHTRKLQIQDVVKVSLDPPPPIYPGLSHEFILTFSPTTFDSWEGQLHFDSPVGPFVLPIKCYEKRFDPILSRGQVTFTNVILGTSASVKVKLINRGSMAGLITRIHEAVDRKLTLKSVVMDHIYGFDSATDVNRSLSARPKSSGSGRSRKEVSIFTSRSDNLDHDAILDRPKSRAIYNDIRRSKSARLTDQSARSRRSTRKRGLEADSEVHLPVPSNSVVDIPLPPPVFSVALEEGAEFRLLANGELTLVVTYTPPVPGNHSAVYEIEFENPDILPLKLSIEGSAIENPFIATPLNVNMNVCLMNMTYQQPIEIRNNSKGTGKIVPRVPSTLRPFVEVVPPKGVPSLPGTGNLFSVKFHPRPELLEDPNLNRFYDESSRILDFPVVFTLEGFPFPVPGPLTCTFQAILDNPEIQLIPNTTMDFGLCFTTETVRKRIEIKSLAVVPQHFGFVDLPDWVTVQPNYGFGTLFPGESRQVDILVSLTPSMAGKQRVTLKLRTLEKKEQTLGIKVIGKLPCAAFTYSHILFPVTSIGSTTSAITEIYLKGSIPRPRGNRGHAHGPITKFKFLVDEKFPIDIAPSSGTIQPGRGQKLLVTFAADLSDEAIRTHLSIYLQRKFEQNLENIQLELTTATATSGEVNEPPSSRQTPRKMSNSAGEARKSTMSPRKSTRSWKSLIRIRDENPVIRTFEDLRLIFSDGKVGVTQDGNQLKKLELRKGFLMTALKATLDPTGPSASLRDLDYAKLRRDLIQNLTPQVDTFKVPCRLTLADGKEEFQLLTLRCPIQKPDLVILDGSPAEVNFGKVKVGKGLVKEVNLHNTSIGTLDLKMDIVSPYGPFTRVNALRHLAPNLVFTLRLKFQPTAQKHYEESLRVFAGESQIILKLTGDGK